MAKKNNNEKENDKVEIIENNNTVNVENKEKKEETIQKKPREILANEYIQVRSVTEGGLIYADPRTNMRYIWNNYGALQSMTFEAILSMNASYPVFLSTPLVVIDDEDVVEKLHVKYIYDTFDFEIANNLDKFFELPIDKMREIIRKSPIHMKENFKLKARDLYQKKILSDLNKIQMLKEELYIDLQILSDDYE